VQPTYGQQQYSPCEHACGQISRCNLSPYAGCVAQCRQNGTEQQQGGPQNLMLLAQSSCEQLQVAMQQTMQPQQPSSTAPASTDQPSSTAPVSTGQIDVDFDVPPGYSSARQGTMVVLTPAHLDDNTPCVYGISPARASSGSYERDAFAALLEPMPGWQRKDENYYAMRGTAATGWPFYWIRTDAVRPGPSYEYMAVMAMAFPASNGATNIVWGIGNPAKCLADDASFARLFHSLRPRGWQTDGGRALAQDLVGLWRNSQSIGMGQYRFDANGRYEFAINTTTEIGYLERTSTSLHQGSYTLSDGVLTLSPDRKSRGTERLRIRVYDEFSLGKWQRSLTTLDESHHEPREVQYYRIERQ
jgi:hypothetical protein